MEKLTEQKKKKNKKKSLWINKLIAKLVSNLKITIE